MWNRARTLSVVAVSLFVLGAAVTSGEAGGVTVGPFKQVEPPDDFSNPSAPIIFGAEKGKIGYHPATGRYAVVYLDDVFFPGAMRSVFLDANGNRISSPLFLTGEGAFGLPVPVNVLPFPFSTSMLVTFQANGLDSFGNNVFVGDMAGIGFAGTFSGGISNYTNGGGDKFVANNCGEFEGAGPSAVDVSNLKFLSAYTQGVHVFDNGSCRTSRVDLMVGYHQNSQPFGFTNGPWFVETGATAAGAEFNALRGEVWLAYVSPSKQLKAQRYTPGGTTGGVIAVSPADGVNRFGFALAINPFNGNVVASWRENVPRPGTSETASAVFARVFDSTGAPVGGTVRLSDPATQHLFGHRMAATRDHFLIVSHDAPISGSRQVVALVLDPQGNVASDWTQVDTALGRFLDINFDLTANPDRRTYALLLQSGFDLFFAELTPIVNRAPTAGADTATTTEEMPVDIDVLANDTDPDGDPFDLLGVDSPAHGTATVNADQTIRYVPATDFSGTDTFTYTLRDSNGNESVGTVTVTVTPVNDTPVGAADGYRTPEDTALVTATPSQGVLGNDSDPDGDTLTAQLVTGPSNATSFTLNPDGTFTYVPAANFHGTDTFTYRPHDSTVAGATVTVTIVVESANDAPVGAADAYATDEDTPLAVTSAAQGVLGNDGDADGQSLTAQLVQGPSHAASFTLDAAGTFTYVPAANFHGTDRFTYQPHDGSAAGNTVTVTIAVRSVNDTAVGVAESYATDEDTPLVVGAPAQGVLANDTDGDGDVLTAQLVSGPSSAASFTLNPNGTFTYVPAANSHGTDTFRYQPHDGTTAGNVVTVTITVRSINDVPVGVADAYSTSEDTPLVVSTLAQGVLANDSDADGQGLTAQLVQGPSQAASFTLNPDGTFTYVPAANVHGTDAFTYRPHDGTAAGNAVSVTITVRSVNDAPVGRPEGYVADEDTPLVVAMPAQGILANDTDVDGASLTAQLVTGPANAASFTLNPDGTFAYAPAANFHGTDSFTYRPHDGTAAGNAVIVTITVRSMNDAPVAVDDVASTVQGNPVTIAVLTNDTDVDGDVLRIASVSTTSGTAVVNGDGTLTFTPPAGFSGAAAISYTVSDSRGGSSTGQVTVMVQSMTEASAALVTQTQVAGINQLNAAARNIERQITAGQTTQAARTLARYIDEVNRHVARGGLTASQGTVLIAQAQALLNALP